MVRDQTEAFRSSECRVAVIGAGMSGLTAAKCLLDEGIRPVVFEQAATIGGLWNYSEELPDGGSVMYRSVQANASTRTTAFSDFPFPDTLPDFPRRSDMLAYLRATCTKRLTNAESTQASRVPIPCVSNW
jgi:cation diffusion facilitator CzcD-associated flavoprotein CzcO